jgi:hypothetical protein
MPCVPVSPGRQNKANSHCDADQEIGVPGQPNVRNKPNSQGRAEAMDVESATVCQPHPRPVAGHFLFESPSPRGV